MSEKTLTSDQIRVSDSAKSISEVLRSASPYFDKAIRTVEASDPNNCDPIEMPANIVRDLIVVLAAEQKRIDGLMNVERNDKGDGDWNPFKGIDFEFD